MGYASRANSTAAHFATSAGAVEARVQREAHEATLRQAATLRRRVELNALEAAVHAPNAARRFGPVRLALALEQIAKMRAPRG